MLDKVSITGGKFLSTGANFNLGIKDTPVHISRKNYMQKLRWVSSKYIVLWDEEDKRGWLVKGTSALLYLVRASLRHYQNDDFREAFLSTFDDISEPPENSQEDYAISILRRECNMKLPIFADKDEIAPDEEDKRTKRFYRVEDRVDELYEILEKLIDHQINAAGQAGVKMKAHVRRHLVGWDFKDIASDRDPIYPHVATLHALGKGWVDFVRSIQAVTLLGRGFGRVIRSSGDPTCLDWAEVPKDRYYLAACVSDLRRIMEMDGDCEANPVRICNGISWFSPSAPFDACRCTRVHSRGHSDYTQMLWPTSLLKILPRREKLPLPENGAVIFGHNVKINWRWEDMGNPVEGNPILGSPETEEEEFLDSGIGLTENSDSGRSAGVLPDHRTYEMPVSQSQITGSSNPISESVAAQDENLQDNAGSNAIHSLEPGMRRSKQTSRIPRIKRYFNSPKFGK